MCSFFLAGSPNQNRFVMQMSVKNSKINVSAGCMDKGIQEHVLCTPSGCSGRWSLGQGAGMRLQGLALEDRFRAFEL